MIVNSFNQKRLESNEYGSIEEVAADVRLVWTNCMTYNQVLRPLNCRCLFVYDISVIQDGSEYYQLADTFARKFEERYAQVVANIG